MKTGASKDVQCFEVMLKYDMITDVYQRNFLQMSYLQSLQK